MNTQITLRSVYQNKKKSKAHDSTMRPQCPDRTHCNNTPSLSHCPLQVRQAGAD